MKKALQKQIEEAQGADFLTPAYRKKKLTMWAIRTVLAVLMYYFLWDVKWIRWSLWLYVPLNLFVPISLLGGNYFLNKKIKRVNKLIEEIGEKGNGEEE